MKYKLIKGIKERLYDELMRTKFDKYHIDVLYDILFDELNTYDEEIDRIISDSLYI
jgi:hypothetical protein